MSKVIIVYKDNIPDEIFADDDVEISFIDIKSDLVNNSARIEKILNKIEALRQTKQEIYL